MSVRLVGCHVMLCYDVLCWQQGGPKVCTSGCPPLDTSTHAATAKVIRPPPLQLLTWNAHAPVHSSVASASIAASTAGQPIASPNIHSTTAPLIVASVIISPRLIGPMRCRLAFASVGASGVSLTWTSHGELQQRQREMIVNQSTTVDIASEESRRHMRHTCVKHASHMRHTCSTRAHGHVQRVSAWW
jgi:hypothetical protein